MEYLFQQPYITRSANKKQAVSEKIHIYLDTSNIIIFGDLSGPTQTINFIHKYN